MPSRELLHHHEEKKTYNIQEHLSHIEDFQKIAEIFKQLGDTTKIRIVWQLLIILKLPYTVFCSMQSHTYGL